MAPEFAKRKLLAPHRTPGHQAALQEVGFRQVRHASTCPGPKLVDPQLKNRREENNLSRTTQHIHASQGTYTLKCSTPVFLRMFGFIWDPTATTKPRRCVDISQSGCPSGMNPTGTSLVCPYPSQRADMSQQCHIEM